MRRRAVLRLVVAGDSSRLSAVARHFDHGYSFAVANDLHRGMRVWHVAVGSLLTRATGGTDLNSGIGKRYDAFF